MEILDWVWQFIKVILIIVTIHELGHFLAARMCGMRADIFAVGMGPRLFGWNKKTKFTFGKLPDTWESEGFTDYRLCALPIGGYVKIVGMVDESMDTTQMQSKPQPWEFRSKNALQKAFVLSAGVIMNFLLAIAVFAGLALSNGKTMRVATPVGYVEKNTLAEKSGFMAGDEIIAINGQQCATANEIQEHLLLTSMGDDRIIAVRRSGETTTLTVNGKELMNAMTKQEKLGLYFSGSSVVVGVADITQPAGRAGIAAGDTVVTVNGVPIFSVDQLIASIGSNKNKQITVEIKRGNSVRPINVTPNNDGKIGVALGEKFHGSTIHENYSVFAAVGEGMNQTWNYIALTGNVVKNIFTGKVSTGSTISGPVGMIKMAGQQSKYGFEAFLSFVAIISISIALMNILPFPALDGGHLVIIAIEAIIRRELSLKIKMIVQNVGMVFLLLLILLVSFNDVMKLVSP